MSKIQELKEQHNCETSDDLLDILSPPDYQCGNIDSIFKKVSIIEKLSNYKHDDEEELKNKLDEINYYIRDFEDELEDLRTAIDDVRRWGQDWKSKAKEMIEKYNVDIDELL